MTKRNYLVLFAVGLLVTGLVANFQAAPGYMDADYYFYSAIRLAEGDGFSEEILWNYLDEPGGLPHPSHAYWLPLPSLIAALGLRLFPALDVFSAARLPFVFLGALAAPLTAYLAYQLGQRKDQAWLAGGLALFSAFYLPYQSTVETFAPGLFLGAFFFILLMNIEDQPAAFLLGLVTGLIYLTRAEGLVWLFAGLVFLLYLDPTAHSLKEKARNSLHFFIGTTLVAGPWLLRQYAAFGSLGAPGAGRTLWLTGYEELFTYPADTLTVQRWLAAGWVPALADRLEALGQNLLSALVVQGGIVLWPLILLGAIHSLKPRLVKLGGFLWLALLLLLSLAFPYSGIRGGFFHAGTLLQPLLWALAAIGLREAVVRLGKRRGWPQGQAWRVFAVAALFVALTLSAYVVCVRVIGGELANPQWDDYYQHYAEMEQQLAEAGISPVARVLVNNPAGYALASGRAALVIPNGPLATSLMVAENFDVDYLILESNHPSGLEALYESQRADGLELLFTLDGTLVYRIVVID